MRTSIAPTSSPRERESATKKEVAAARVTEARALVKPEAIKDSPHKIDAVIAAVCAWAALQEKAEVVSIYNEPERGASIM